MVYNKRKGYYMLNKLKKIAATIDKLIRDDDFPATIQPAFLKDAVTDYPNRGGKRLRPALLLWSCGLLGGKTENALPAAAAVEIYHNWTLVHDDIIDNDDVRRGQPATHRKLNDWSKSGYGLQEADGEKFGRDFAILAGDIQQGWAANMLLKSTDYGVSPELTVALSRRLHQFVNRELISGEALDVDFSYRHDGVTADEVYKMIYLKTSVLLQFCAETGAAIALNCKDFSHPDIKRLGEFAAAAGMAFQLKDDWLGIFGDSEKLGKPICSDLAEGKPTILLMSALKRLKEEDRIELQSYLRRKTYSAQDIARVRELMIKSGAEADLKQRIETLMQKAHNLLNEFPENQYRDLLSQFTDYLSGRDK